MSSAVLVAVVAIIAIAAIAYLLSNSQAGLNTAPDTNVNLPDVNVETPLPNTPSTPAQ